MKILYGPREKLAEKGVNSLTDEELLAILIKTGTKENDVLNLSKKILEETNYLKNLNDYTFEELMSFKGIGKAKAMTIVCALELSNRIKRKKISIKTIKTPKDIYEYVRNDYIGLNHEKIEAIYMDSNLRIVSKQVVSEGDYNRSLLNIKEVTKRALKLNASYISIVHNHPSSLNKPSKEDVKSIEELERILLEFQIILFDSIIIFDDNYFSMKYKMIF